MINGYNIMTNEKGIPVAIRGLHNNSIVEVHPLECVFLTSDYAEYNTSKNPVTNQIQTGLRVLCYYNGKTLLVNHRIDISTMLRGVML